MIIRSGIQEHSDSCSNWTKGVLMITLSSEELQAQRSDFGLRLSEFNANTGRLAMWA